MYHNVRNVYASTGADTEWVGRGLQGIRTPPPFSAESYYGNYIKTGSFWGVPRTPANKGWTPPFGKVGWWTPSPFEMYASAPAIQHALKHVP